jgi:hypothetical protein
MKHIGTLAAASLLAISLSYAAEPPPGPPGPPRGFDMNAVNTVLPLEGAPKAIPGKYAVVTEPAFGTENLKIVRPTDLSAFPKKDTLPVVVWVNGGCAIENAKVAGFYDTVASHGFLFITTTATPGAARRSATIADMKAGIDWATAENAREGSPLKGKIQTSKVALMGNSCGGMLSVQLGADPRVTTIGVFNSGAQGDMKALTAALHTPVLIIDGGERDPLMKLAHDTFNTIDRWPAFYGSRHGAGHTATLNHPGGGEWANVAWHWAEWQLKGNKKSGKMFTGKKCELCTNANWDVERKNLK